MTSISIFLALVFLSSSGMAFNFDYLTFAQSWTPTMCMYSVACTHHFPVENEFIMHGLWPTDFNDHLQPEYCEGWNINSVLFYGREVPPDLEAMMDRWWPAFSMPNRAFWSHEWRKHGTCSGWSRRRYLHEAISLARTVSLFTELGLRGITPIDAREPAQLHTREAFNIAISSVYVPISGGAQVMQVGLDCHMGQLSKVRICRDPITLDFIDCPEQGNCEDAGFRFVTYSDDSQQKSKQNPNSKHKVRQQVSTSQQVSTPLSTSYNVKVPRPTTTSHLNSNIMSSYRSVSLMHIILTLCLTAFCRGANLPYISKIRKRIGYFTLSHLEPKASSCFLSLQSNMNLSSKSEEYSKELYVAVKAVEMACSKDWSSSVAVAGWCVKAVVSCILSAYLGGENISILAEADDVHTLSNTNASELLETVVKIVHECLSEAPQFGFEAVKRKSPLGISEVLGIISRCTSIRDPSGRFWTLGFVSGDQYAVGLSLIEDGEVVVGVLGSPNYRKDWFSHQKSYQRIISKLIALTTETWIEGCVVYAEKGSGKAWIQPLIHHGSKKFVWPNHAKPVSASSIDNLGLATLCQSVEKADSNHSFIDGLAHSVGLSMVKYVAIACGDAEVFMQFARGVNKEKIWDHAAGVIIIQEAGGTVTDIGGRSLDFTKGSYVEGIDRGIVACAGSILHEKIIDAVDASWSSSCL